MPWSAVINSVGNLFSNAQQNMYNKDLAEYQNAFNLEMWNKQNEYNSPQATMNRLVQAGINPRAYNQIGQFANSADTPQAATYDKKSPLSAFSDLAMTMAQLRNLKTQNEVGQSEAQKNLATANKENALASKAIEDTAGAKYNRENIMSERYHKMIDDRRAAQFRNEVWARERGLRMWTDLDDSFNSDEFANYLKYVQDRRSNSLLSDEKLIQIRTLETMLKSMDIQSIESIPKEYRWIVESFIKLF